MGGDVQQILEEDRKFREIFGFGFLQSEAKLILILKEKGSLTIKEAMSFLGLSYGGFYLTIRRMTDKKYICVKNDDKDGRVRRLYIEDAFLDVV